MNIVAIRFKQVRECMIDISQNLIKIAWEHCKCELWACAKFLFFCNTNANGCKQKARGCNMKNNIGWLWLQTRPVGDSVPWGHLTNQSLGLIFVTHIQWRQHLWPSNNTGAIVLYLQAKNHCMEWLNLKSVTRLKTCIPIQYEKQMLLNCWTKSAMATNDVSTQFANHCS